MTAFSLILLFLVTFAAMEGFAYVMHRWVMHGPGWFLHASHHRERPGRWEANDLYFVIFAMPSVAVACSAQTLTIHSPRNYQVFQRTSMEKGPLDVSGRVRTACDRVLVRITGKGVGGELPDKWQSVKLTKLTGASTRC